MNNGFLTVVVCADDISQPISGAEIRVVGTGVINNTNEFGRTDKIPLETVSIENSLNNNSNGAFSKYDIEVIKDGMSSVIVRGIEIYPEISSTIHVIMNARDLSGFDVVEKTLAPTVLSGEYSPQYQNPEYDFSTFVLNKVIIPEYVIVHDGVPNAIASQYIISFSDYIKNVACSEIYPTWPEEAIKANVLAIISFTLNRIYTEWYLSKGYDFTVTSVTTYDQKYTVGKAIHENVSSIVDEMIPLYIKRNDKQEPLLAHYCDGDKLQNEGWLWQWGSKDLALQGKSYEEILKYYYGDSIEIATASFQEGLPTSFPGYNLELGSCGEEVKYLQNQINIIRGNYPGLIQITNSNGEYDENTKESVLFFQKTFNLKETGIVDYVTWYKISYYYLAVKRMIFGTYDR